MTSQGAGMMGSTRRVEGRARAAPGGCWEVQPRGARLSASRGRRDGSFDRLRWSGLWWVSPESRFGALLKAKCAFDTKREKGAEKFEASLRRKAEHNWFYFSTLF